ncbi:hypothetical protein BST29_10425 [Mycobacterium malmoense]|uniref:PE-PGRS family protein n=1 Tax=Mycobacterium malmoense TaxID=1780 RepID=A0ABX3SSQ3_MYCMA|nr:hypothetical protein BST29_10425 [Mycobacterium malmoense]
MVVDLAARPHITAVALATAGVIAAAPVAQHLPELRLAQHLRQVSVSDINLTDAASGVVDLFSGVENELASLASGASVAAVPAATVGAFVNPITNWINVLQTAANNIGVLGQDWLADPMPLASQVMLNQFGYGSALATGVNGFSNGFFNTLASAVPTAMQTAWTDLTAGNLSGALNTWFTVLNNAILSGGFGIIPALAIPTEITTNLNNLVTEATSFQVLLDAFLAPGFVYFNEGVAAAFVDSAQGAIDAVQAGNPVGALSAIVNAPANITGDILNGFTSISGHVYDGVLSTSFPYQGLAETFGIDFPQMFAQSIGAKAGQNTSSLIPGALNTFGSTVQTSLTNLWTTLTADLGQMFPSLSGLTSVLQNIPSALAPLGSLVGNLTGQVGSIWGNIAGQVGTLLINLLKLL